MKQVFIKCHETKIMQGENLWENPQKNGATIVIALLTINDWDTQTGETSLPYCLKPLKKEAKFI